MVGREMVLSCGLDGDSDEVRGPVRHRERKDLNLAQVLDLTWKTLEA